MRVLVTGAASGIGAALVARLRARGDDVIASDRTQGDNRITADLSDPGGAGALAAAVDGPLDGIALVAGLPGTHPPARILQVNTLANMALLDALAPKLADGAAVVAVSSITAHRSVWDESRINRLLAGDHDGIDALTGEEAYALSKAALNRWALLTAAMLKPRGIRLTTVSPGPIDTPILKDFEESMGKDRMEMARMMVGRHGQADEVAAAIAFLLSDDARWISGTDLKVDGGFHAVRAAYEAGRLQP